MKLRSGYIKITDEIREELIKQKKRTGVAELTLLKGDKEIDSSIVSTWLLKKTKQASHEKLKYVLKKWEALPNKEDAFVQLTEEKREEIRTAINQTGAKTKSIFAGRTDTPEGFNRQILAIMTSHKGTSTKRVKKEYVDYILKICSEFNL